MSRNCNQTEPQYAEIELPDGCGIPAGHCPICGNALGQEGEVTPCPHLAFVYATALGSEFVYKSQDFEEKIKGIDDDKFTFGSFRECLRNAGYGNRLLVLEIGRTGRMGCGPSGLFANVYGFDFDSLAREASDEDALAEEEE